MANYDFEGQDYGSAGLAGFIPAMNISLVVQSGSEYGMNCNLNDMNADISAWGTVWCYVKGIMFSILSDGKYK